MRGTSVVAVLVGMLACLSAQAQPSAEEILKASGTRGGLVVQLGCGDGAVTAALWANDTFVVQGLDTDPANVQRTRAHIQSLGLGGKVSADTFDGQHLPYVDNLVNLVVAEDLASVSAAEVMRVLSPGSAAYVKREGTWSKTIKPWPENLDQWTHYLHDPLGTSVSGDQLAGHPEGLRWTGGPLWARSHEHTASMQAMVSAGGRVFSVIDEGSIESIQLPSKTVLTARDAFNGVILWKLPLHNWFNALFPLKSGPGWMPRRLVAVDDKVYVAPGIGQDVLCVDAVTGEVIRTYDDTAATFELIVSDGVVFAAIDPNGQVCDYNQQNANCWKERDRGVGTRARVSSKQSRPIAEKSSGSARCLSRR